MFELGQSVGCSFQVSTCLPSVFLWRIALPGDEEFDDAAALTLGDDAVDNELFIAVAIGCDRWWRSIVLLRSIREQASAVAIRLQLLDVAGRMQRLQLGRQFQLVGVGIDDLDDLERSDEARAEFVATVA